MKILFPIGSFYPAQEGGPSNAIYWIAKYLQKEDIETTVVTKDTGIKSKHNIITNQWIELDGIKVIYTKNKYHQLPFRMLKESIKQIKQNDIVLLTSIFYIPSIILSIVASYYNKRIIWSPRGELETAAIKYNSLYKKIRLFIIKKISKNKNVHFHSTSFSETQNIKTILKTNRIVELPNFYELPEKQNQTLKNNFLFVGRIHSIKALDKIIEGLSLSRLFKSENYKFTIVGQENETGYLDRLKKQIHLYHLKNFVEFTGSKYGKDKEKIYASSKFFLLLSHSENFGNVVLESLAQGTPVVASKGTPWQILEKEKAGFWIDNTPKEIAKIIDKIIMMPEKDYLQYRENAYRLVKTKFDIEDNIDNWIKVLNQINNV